MRAPLVLISLRVKPGSIMALTSFVIAGLVPAVTGRSEIPKYWEYFFLISSVAASCATGSDGNSLICDSGVSPGLSFTSGWNERRPATSTRYCWVSRENKKLMNSRAA